MKTLLLICISLLVFGQSAPHRAWIATRLEDDRLHISGHFANHSEKAISLRYEMQTLKEGTSGRSRSSQSGRFRAASEEEVRLSRTTVNLHPNDTYTIELKIFRGDSLYLRDQIEY